jgi:tetrahydromethanopterin S-methyltransferase subunit G
VFLVAIEKKMKTIAVIFLAFSFFTTSFPNDENSLTDVEVYMSKLIAIEEKVVWTQGKIAELMNEWKIFRENIEIRLEERLVENKRGFVSDVHHRLHPIDRKIDMINTRVFYIKRLIQREKNQEENKIAQLT